MSIALNLARVTVRYRAGSGACLASVIALDRVDLVVACGDAVGIVGDAGAGKSTLLLCAAGLLPPDSGRVSWFERRRALEPHGDRVVYVPEVASSVSRLLRLRVLEEPRLILLDDPLRAIDGTTYAQLDRWIDRARARGHAVLVATRDQNAVQPLVSRTCL